MLNNLNKKQLLYVVLSVLVLIDLYALTQYNSDWPEYEYGYYNPAREFDFGYSIIQNIFYDLKFEYRDFYILCEIITYIMMYYIYTKFSRNNLFLLLLFFCFCLNPNYSILIRHYLAFPFFVLGYINFFRSRRILGLSLLFVSFSFHSGIILLLPLFPLFNYIERQRYIDVYRIIKKLLIISTCLFVFSSLVISIANFLGISVFNKYVDDLSSLLGTLFMGAEFYPWFIVGVAVHYKLAAKCNYLYKDLNYRLLLTCNFFPFMYLFISHFSIIQYRVYESLMFLSFTYLSYTFVKYKGYLKYNGTLIILFLLIITILQKYFTINYWNVILQEIYINNSDSILLKSLLLWIL